MQSNQSLFWTCGNCGSCILHCTFIQSLAVATLMMSAYVHRYHRCYPNTKRFHPSIITVLGRGSIAHHWNPLSLCHIDAWLALSSLVPTMSGVIVLDQYSDHVIFLSILVNLTSNISTPLSSTTSYKCLTPHHELACTNVQPLASHHIQNYCP